MTELQDGVCINKAVTKIDLKNGSHLIRIKEGDAWKTAFCGRDRLSEFLVMPFKLTNALASFQDMMNHILKDLLDKSIVVYIDDFLIYAKKYRATR
jgi:hypothetical protein